MSQQQIEDQVLALVAKLDLQHATFLLAKISSQLFARTAAASQAVPQSFISVRQEHTVVLAAGGLQAEALRAVALGMEAQMKASQQSSRMIEFDGDGRTPRR